MAIAGSFNGDVNELEFGNVSANAVGAIAADAKMVVIATPRRLTFFKISLFTLKVTLVEVVNALLGRNHTLKH